MLRLRHAARLTADIVAYAAVNRVWWILPVMAILAAAATIIVVGQAAAPLTLYPMF